MLTSQRAQMLATAVGIAVYQLRKGQEDAFANPASLGIRVTSLSAAPISMRAQGVANATVIQLGALATALRVLVETIAAQCWRHPAPFNVAGGGGVSPRMVLFASARKATLDRVVRRSSTFAPMDATGKADAT